MMCAKVVFDENLSRRRVASKRSEPGIDFMLVMQSLVNVRVPCMLGPHYQPLTRGAAIHKPLQFFNRTYGGLFKAKRRRVFSVKS
jgi:hypothetical protein